MNKKEILVYSIVLILVFILLFGVIFVFVGSDEQKNEHYVENPVSSITSFERVNEIGDEVENSATSSVVDKEEDENCEGKKFEGEYRTKKELIELSNTNKVGLEDYEKYDNGDFSFFYPEFLVVKDYQNRPRFSLRGKDIMLYINIVSREDFINDYNKCLDREFGCVEIYGEIRFEAGGCSESDSSDNLEKILSGDYIEYYNVAGSGTGAGTGIVFNKSINDDFVINVYHSNMFAGFLPYTKGLYSEKRYNEFTDEEKKQMDLEIDEFEQMIITVVKSFNSVEMGKEEDLKVIKDNEGWFAYENKEYGFRINYPVTWKGVKGGYVFNNSVATFISSTTEKKIKKSLEGGAIEVPGGDIVLIAVERKGNISLVDYLRENSEIVKYDNNNDDEYTSYYVIERGFRSYFAAYFEGEEYFYKILFELKDSLEKLDKTELEILGSFELIF